MTTTPRTTAISDPTNVTGMSTYLEAFDGDRQSIEGLTKELYLSRRFDCSVEATEERINQLIVLVAELLLKNQMLRVQIKEYTDKA